MRALKLSILLVIFLSVNYSSFSQNKKTKRADASFDAGEYFKASEMYTKI